MKPLTIQAALALAAIVMSAPSFAQPALAQDPIALIHANVIDVRTGAVTRDATVTLREGRIERIAREAPPPGIRTFDLKGKYLVPGLIDAHTHLDNLRAARRALESGVTTIRSASVGSFRDVVIRELSKKGVIAGPDVVAAGIFVTTELGQDDVLADPALADALTAPDTAEKLRRIVRVNLAHGVDVIKTRGTERAGSPGTDPRQQSFTEQELRAVVEEAAKKGIPVECHAHGEEGARGAVLAGVRSIEHGTYMSDDTLRLMKERGTFLMPNYSTSIDLMQPGGDYDDPALQIRGQHMVPRRRSLIQRAHQMGIKIVTGTDTGYGPQSVTRIGQEIAAFASMGFTPLQAIQAATLTGAELLRIEKQTGAIEPGLEADLIAVDGNPLEDIIVVQDPLLVISNGRIGLNRLEFGKKTATSLSSEY